MLGGSDEKTTLFMIADVSGEIHTEQFANTNQEPNHSAVTFAHIQ
jgi:hypothetical protein